MYDNLHCKIFIDTDLIYEEMFALILNLIILKKRNI